MYKNLWENIKNFDIIDYQDENIIDNHTIDNIVIIVKDTDELNDILQKRYEKNPQKPYLLDIDTSLITDMSSLFTYYEELEILDLSTWDTSNVENMMLMFQGCSNLKKIIFPNFNTSNVRNMSHMFSGCSSLKTLDLSHFDTSNVEYMHYMFFSCSKLKRLDLSTWDTSKVTDISYMFNNCNTIDFLDLSCFNNIKLIDNIFQYIPYIKKLKLSKTFLNRLLKTQVGDIQII